MNDTEQPRTRKPSINFVGDATGTKILSLLQKEAPLLEHKHRIEEKERQAQLEQERLEDTNVQYVNKDKVLYEGTNIPSHLAASLTSTAVDFDEEKHRRIQQRRLKQVVKITQKGFNCTHSSFFLYFLS